MAHSYDEARASTALKLIRELYAPELSRFLATFEEKAREHA